MWAFFIASYLSVFFACSGGKIKDCPQESSAKIPKATAKKLSSPEKMVLLLDYSGSMLPGYQRDKTKVKTIPNCKRCKPNIAKNGLGIFYYRSEDFSTHLAKWLDAATPKGKNMQLEILLFNRGVFHYNPETKSLSPYKKSSFSLDVGKASSGQIKKWIDGIPDSPYKATKGLCGKKICPNETHTKEAVQKIIRDLNKEDTILWLVTDNIIDNPKAGNSKEAKRNKAFYDYINSEKSIHMIKAYPTNQQKDCSWMCGSSLFTYGMYLSKNKDALFVGRKISGEQKTAKATKSGLLWNSKLQKLASASSCSTKSSTKLQGVPVRLKPVDDNVLSINIGKAKCFGINMNDDNISCRVSIEVQNNLHHQIVEQASVKIKNENLKAIRKGESGEWEDVDWIGDICPDTVNIKKWTLEDGSKHSGKEKIILKDLQPRDKVKLTVTLSLPNVAPQHQSMNDLLDIATTKSLYRNGHLIAEVTDIQTKLALNEQELECVYGAKDLPKIFRDSEQSKPAYAKQAIPLLLKNNGQIIAIALLGAIAIGGLLTMLVLMRFQKKYYELTINGDRTEQVALPRISSVEFSCNNDPRPWIRIKRGWNKAQLQALPGFVAVRQESHWEVYPIDDEDNVIPVTFREGWGVVGGSSGGGDLGLGDDDAW